MKKTGKILLLTILLVLTALPISAQAASQKKAALEAYERFLCMVNGPSQFAIAYVDKDSVPELFLGCNMFTYKNGEVVAIRNNSVRNGYYQYNGYYKKKGIVIGQNSRSNYDDYYCKVSGLKFSVKLLKANLTGRGTGEKNYYYNAKRKQISKSQFRKSLKKLTGGKKMAKLKYYDNIPVNRAKYLK